MTSATPAGRVALISGGASGIGLAVAALLRRDGWRLALMDLAEPALAAAAQQLGGGAEVLTLAGDVTVPADCERAVAAALQRFGAVDLCWCNAGVGTFGPLRHAPADEWLRVVQVNLFGVFHLARAATEALIASQGQIAVSASVASLAHAPGMSAYAASKAGVEAMCNSWRIELAHHGVAVTCIHPLWIATPMVERGSASLAFARLREGNKGPIGTVTPLEVAAPLIHRGIVERRRRVFVPGWVRWLYALRAALHLRPMERDLLAAAPDLEGLYLEDVRRGLVPPLLGVPASNPGAAPTSR